MGGESSQKDRNSKAYQITQKVTGVKKEEMKTHRARMKTIFNLFVVIFKNSLQYIHKIIMTEDEEKRNHYPSKIEGHGELTRRRRFFIKPKIFLQTIPLTLRR